MGGGESAKRRKRWESEVCICRLAAFLGISLFGEWFITEVASTEVCYLVDVLVVTYALLPNVDNLQGVSGSAVLKSTS